jgi:hypothetical protein
MVFFGKVVSGSLEIDWVGDVINRSELACLQGICDFWRKGKSSNQTCAPINFINLASSPKINNK